VAGRSGARSLRGRAARAADALSAARLAAAALTGVGVTTGFDTKRSLRTATCPRESITKTRAALADSGDIATAAAGMTAAAPSSRANRRPRAEAMLHSRSVLRRSRFMRGIERTPRLVSASVLALLTAAGVAGCGGASSGNAGSLLRQTFSGPHRVNSGNLNFALTLTPSGSRTLSTPITLSFSGPFQSLGSGKLPASNFNISLNAAGTGGSVGILSTGTNGYVTFQGQSYQLPKADFQRLESSFSSLSSSPGGSGSSGVLSKLGIQPLHWLVNPQVVGDESVAGTTTTHIHASVDVAALLNDFNTFLQKAASLGVSGSASFPRGISAASRTRIAGEIQRPTFDVWTGKADKTIRKLLINLTLPVSGKTSTLLGGLRSADIGLSLEYAQLNEPQTITAPTTVLPYSQFQTKLHAFEQSLSSGLGALSGGSTSSTGSSGSSSSSGGTSTTNYQRYSSCIQSANGDIAKMQQCSSLLGGG
jgi:hypothetical protein